MNYESTDNRGGEGEGRKVGQLAIGYLANVKSGFNRQREEEGEDFVGQ